MWLIIRTNNDKYNKMLGQICYYGYIYIYIYIYILVITISYINSQSHGMCNLCNHNDIGY